MSDTGALIAGNLDIWIGAIEWKSGAGRGGGKRINLYGIERLRALILDLAVRGKLVAQDPSDEPAADLLRRIGAERTKLIKEKKIGKGKSFPAVSDTPPFDIPENWVWTQISEVGHDWGQQEPSSDFTYIDVSAIDQSAGVIRSPNIVAAKDAPSRARKIVQNGTIIYSTVRPYLLNIAIIDQEFKPEPIASTAFAVIHPFDGIRASFIYRYLRSPAFVKYVENCQTGIAYPAINDRQFFSAWCPLPPSNEQSRIAAKVDELMTLCDALERDSVDALAAHQTLVEALLGTLVNSVDAADLAANWARLESHFDSLFITEASVEALVQMILDLAVRGKLVAQDPSDEPAADLLRRIGAERTKLIKEKKIGKGKSFPAVSDTPPFDIPENWVWTQISEVGHDWGQQEPSSDFTYIDVSAIDQSAGVIRSPNIVAAKDAPSRARKIVQNGTIIYSTVRPYLLNIAIIDQEFKPEPIASTAFAVIHPFDGIRASFIYRYLRSPAFVKYVENCQTGIAYPAINDRQFFSAWCPLPPSNEQSRIAAKVDELMTLCDALKARLADAAETSRNLADAIIGRAAA